MIKKENLSKKKNKAWNGLLKDHPCFIVGNGPSASNIPYHKISNFFTIGINKAYKLIDTNILMWQDIEFWYTDRKEIVNKKSIKYCRDTADPYKKFTNFKLVSGQFKMPENNNTLYGTGASGPLSFQLASILGCNPIVFIGFDCCYKGGATNFYGKNPFHKPHTLKNCQNGLFWINSFNKEKEIICCSENTVFENKKSIDEAIELCLKKNKPMGFDYYSKILK